MSINITGGIPTWFYDQFHRNIYEVQQQSRSKFQDAVMTMPLGAEDMSFDLMDTLELTKKTGRSPDTPIIEASAQRRWVAADPYDNAVLYDQDDDLSILLDPTNSFVSAFAKAAKRKKDDVILSAFDADVNTGRRNTGSSTVSWTDSKYSRNASYGRVIAHDCSVGPCSSADTGMTVEKIMLVREYFERNEVDEDEPIFMMINPIQATDLFGQEEYANIDYAANKPLPVGRIIPYHGVNFIVTNKVTLGSSNDVDTDINVYECWAWTRQAIVFAVAQDMTIKISDRPDKSHSQQVYAKLNIGAMRFNEDLVCKVECQG